MNATAIPVDELIGQLLDAADGILADTAAAGLIISHENFLHRDAFRRIISTGASISTGQPLATIGWDAALRAWTPGRCPAHPPSRRSCGSPPASAIRHRRPARTVLGNLDRRNITWSLTPSPPPTANHHSFRGAWPQIGCRTVLAFIDLRRSDPYLLTS